MDLNLLMPWLGALALFISLGTSIHTFITSGSKQVATQLKAAEKTLIDHDRRIQAVESDMRHLPDRDHAHRMEVAIEKLTGVTRTLESQLSGRMDTLDERLKPVAAISDRLQEFLLEQARK